MIRLVLLLCLLGMPAAAADLPRSQIVLASAISVDAEANTVTLPLHRGRVGSQAVWYILTDASDPQVAADLGVVHAPLLAHAGHVQTVIKADDGVVFRAAPDFSALRKLVPGPQGFPPQSASPGATAPTAYSPFIRTDGESAILNAPIVAIGDGPFDVTTHSNTADRVLAIDTENRTVTLLLSHGFAEGRRIVYISTEASDAAAAVLERAIHVPQLNEGSADIGLLVFVDGAGQGLRHLLHDARAVADATLATAGQIASPGNILTAFPTGKTARGYSPLWSVTPMIWTGQPGAVQTAQADIYRLAAAKTVAGPDGQPMQPAGFAVNCPVIAWIDGLVP